MDLADLCDAMDHLSSQTWRDYADGSRYGLTPGEESITDRNLLQLRRQFPDLHVHRYTRQREHTVGADWEWWIGSDADGWLCLRVQAKRVFTTTYQQLDHPGVEEGDHQYDTLIKSCREASHFFPFHVFYNGWEETRFADRDGARLDITALESNECWPPYASDDGVQAWGCSALSSYRVAALHSPGGRTRSSIPRYLEHSMPWSELFAVGADRVPDSPKTELDLIHEHLVITTRNAARSSALAPGPAASHAGRRERLPSYAQVVVAGEAERGDVEEFSDSGGTVPARHLIVVELGNRRRRRKRRL